MLEFFIILSLELPDIPNSIIMCLRFAIVVGRVVAWVLWIRKSYTCREIGP